MESNTIVMAALGRALHPGKLYDCRKDSIIPGISLWDNETIKKGLDSYRQPKTELNFSASDSLNEKAKLLDVSASLKASFLCGLVEVGGSAKYMRDNKSSARQSRVSLQYSQTTRYESLTMDQIGNITYPEVFQEGTATHVVTAVLYGAQAFMVFDLTANENEDKEEIEGNLNVMIEKIPSLSIAGEGALAMSESEKKLANSINCTFYGDYELEQNPTTYMDAIQLYRKLPSLLRERENNAVPMKVWLYPLSRLGEKAATLEREIHKRLITKAETLLEDLGNAETQCNDLITNMTINDFQDVRQRLKMFQDFLGGYKMMFLKSLRRLIPAIRGGTEQEQALTEIIDIHQKSPFRAEKLNERLEYSHAEVNLVNLYTQQLSGVPVVKYSALMNILLNPTVDSVVCFCFTSLMDEDPYLSILTKFLKVDEFEKLPVPPDSADQDIKVWFHKPEVIEKIKDKLYLFKGFFQANKDNTQMRFVIVSVSDPSNPGISIRLYKKGKMVDGAFQPVSKPPAPQVDIQDRNIILKLQKSPTGSTERFRVEYRIINATDSEADVEKWEVKDTPDAQENFTLTGLQLTKQYRIQYRAISEVGMSEASDSVLVSIHGKHKLSLSQKWNWIDLSFISEIRMKVMSSLDKSRWSPSTIKPVVKNLFNNLKIPFEADISEFVRKGTAFHFQGDVPADLKKFNFTFKTGKGEDDDFALNMDVYPEFASNLKVYCDEKWDKLRWVIGCPILKGSTFDIFIVIENENYVLYFNGWRYCFYKHHIPIERLTTLTIDGDVTVNSLGIVNNWNTSAFGDEGSGASHWELSKNLSDGAQPICTRNKPYLRQIPGGLEFGLTFFFQGLVPLYSSGLLHLNTVH
ncbi:cytolytic toxin-alpha [Tachysurus ichikawai]